jgi:hypothetical protein
MTGSMSVNKGKKAERDVANYLTANGIPARRTVRTGDKNHSDDGDITIPGVCIEVKNWSGGLTMGSVETLLRKLEVQKGRKDFGLLVERLDRVADAGKWRVWMSPSDMARLLSHSDMFTVYEHVLGRQDYEPISCRLAYVAYRLKAGGWVDRVVNPFDA